MLSGILLDFEASVNMISSFFKILLMKSIVLAFIAIFGMTGWTAKESHVNVAARINPLHCVPVTDQANRIVNGCYDVSRFVNRNGAVWAVCKLKGTLDGVDLDEDCEVPVGIGDCGGGGPLVSGERQRDCCVSVSFGPCSIGSLSLARVDIDPTEAVCTVADFPGELLCTINTASRVIGTPCDQMVMLLNQLL
jgi:hypothetical protein